MCGSFGSSTYLVLADIGTYIPGFGFSPSRKVKGAGARSLIVSLSVVDWFLPGIQ